MSVMWNRIYGKEKFANLYDRYFACQQLKMTLELTGCKRLVIGHTPQVYCATPYVSGDEDSVQFVTQVLIAAYELAVTVMTVISGELCEAAHIFQELCILRAAVDPHVRPNNVCGTETLTSNSTTDLNPHIR